MNTRKEIHRGSPQETHPWHQPRLEVEVWWVVVGFGSCGTRRACRAPLRTTKRGSLGTDTEVLAQSQSRAGESEAAAAVAAAEAGGHARNTAHTWHAKQVRPEYHTRTPRTATKANQQFKIHTGQYAMPRTEGVCGGSHHRYQAAISLCSSERKKKKKQQLEQERVRWRQKTILPIQRYTEVPPSLLRCTE